MSGKVANRYVALLRGINVGGHNKLPMARLVSMVEDLGCSDVRAYIQSGNVVFTAKSAIARRVPDLLVISIRDQCDLNVPVVMRSAEELRRIVGSNPFLAEVFDESTLSVGFLADKPRAQELSALDPQRSSPDEFAVVGQEIYLRLPNGAARSKLTNAYFDSKLRTTSTFRNWKTVGKLLDLATD